MLNMYIGHFENKYYSQRVNDNKLLLCNDDELGNKI